jgi:hypothetical protein
MTSRSVALGTLLAGAASIAGCAAPAAVDRQQVQAVTIASEPDKMICWVTAVRTDPAGVRIHFNGGGGPLFVGHPGGSWAPDPASPAARTPDGPFLIAKPGDKLSPQNSHHDTCELEVVRRDGRLGVMATAHLNLPGIEPSSASVFMPAAD